MTRGPEVFDLCSDAWRRRMAYGRLYAILGLLTATMALYWMAEWRYLEGAGWKVPPWAVAAIWLPFPASWAIERMANPLDHPQNKPSGPGHPRKATRKPP